jgi:fucose permease
MAGAALIAGGTGSGVALFAGAVLLGAGFAPIFPTAFGLVTARHPAVAGFVSSLLVFGGTFGGSILPYLVGQLFAAGGVPLAAGSMALVCGAIAAIQWTLNKGSDR